LRREAGEIGPDETVGRGRRIKKKSRETDRKAMSTGAEEDREASGL